MADDKNTPHTNRWIVLLAALALFLLWDATRHHTARKAYAAECEQK